MNVYLDTSIVLRVFLKQESPSVLWGKWAKAYVSELLRVEFFRTVDRIRFEGKLTDTKRSQLSQDFNIFWLSCYQIPLDPEVLNRAAGSFPTILRSLDAIHLATALILQSSIENELILLTHDHQLKRAAIASGLEVKE